jgi:hypothetical protein
MNTYYTAFLFLLSLFSQAEQEPRIRQLLTKTIGQADDVHFRYSPASILNVDGRQTLLVVSAVFGVAAHDDSPAEIYAWRSNDGGRTWTKPTLFQERITKANVLSPSFVRLDSKEVLFFFTGTERHIDESAMYYRRSTDNGSTWTVPTKIPNEAGQIDCVTDHAVSLRDGRIILPCYVYVRHKVTHSAEEIHVAYSFSSYSGFALCLYSDDRGHTWKRSNQFTVEARSLGRDIFVAAEEPAVIELKDGRLLMFIRNYTGWFYKSYSSDRGATWSKPVNSGIPAPGATPQLRRIPTTGDILLLYNFADRSEISGPLPRTRLASAISIDEGMNFSSVRILAGSNDYKGKVMMPNVEFVGEDALIAYCDSPTTKNNYSLKQVIVPIKWFYEGDREQSYGEQYLAKLETKSLR